MSKKTKELKNLSAKERASKLDDLKMELIKVNVVGKKTGGKTKEIKKAIARILTFNRQDRKQEAAR